MAIANEGFLWLAGLAIFASLISIYYYLQVIRQMYIEPVPEYATAGVQGITTGSSQVLSPSPLMMGVIVVGLLAVVFVGVYPAPVLDLIEAASQAILTGP